MEFAKLGAQLPVNGEVAELVKHICGPEPRACMPVSVEAAKLGLQLPRFKNDLLALASITHYGSRAWVASLLSHLLRQQELGTLELFNCTAYAAYVQHLEATNNKHAPGS